MRHLSPLPSALFVGLLTAACAFQPAGPPATAISDTAPPPAYYETALPVPAARRIEADLEDAHVVVRKVFVPARMPSPLDAYPHATDDIEIVHFAPRPVGGLPRPVVLMSPILGNDMTLMPEFARGFTRIGYHAAVVVRKDFAFDPETALQDAETEFRVLVMRQKQALDWLTAQPEIDGDRVATFGVSAGAIISACVAGADSRPRANVLVFAGAPLADVLLDTVEDRFQEYGQGVKEATGQSEAEIRLALRHAIRTDPMRLAPRIRTESVLLFVARNDTSVPTRHGMALWEALGRPALRMPPWGHYASFLLQPWMQHEINAFVHARLGPP